MNTEENKHIPNPICNLQRKRKIKYCKKELMESKYIFTLFDTRNQKNKMKRSKNIYLFIWLEVWKIGETKNYTSEKNMS